jgi:hypothetical protein
MSFGHRVALILQRPGHAQSVRFHIRSVGKWQPLKHFNGVIFPAKSTDNLGQRIGSNPSAARSADLRITQPSGFPQKR